MFPTVDLRENAQIDCEIHSVLFPLSVIDAVVKEVCQHGERT